MVAVLVHSALLAWHASASLATTLGDANFTLASQVICFPGGEQTNPGPPVEPGAHTPMDQQSACPICTGMVSGTAILAEPLPEPAGPVVTFIRLTAIARIIVERLAGTWPPPRGPPALT